MKVLIVSHNPVASHNNMGKTLRALFSDFSPNELCQLYVRPTRPDVSACHSFYRITDREVLRGCLHFGHVRGHIVESGQADSDAPNESGGSFETPADAMFFRRHKRNELNLLCRDLAWRLARWYNADLDAWIEREKPTCIFLAPGSSTFIYRVALRIAERRGLPLYTYICDEFYFVSPPTKPLARLRFRLLKRRLEQTMRRSQGLFVICDELADAYHQAFGLPSQVIHTGTDYPIAPAPRGRGAVTGATYLGTLSPDRHRALADVGRALDRINDRLGTQHILFLYTDELTPEAREVLASVRSIRYGGYVTGAHLDAALHQADILLHIESFTPEAVERVKRSVSSKLADCLGSGVPLLAYAPAEVASMRYLQEHHAAVCVTSPDELEDALLTLLEDEQVRRDVTEAALALAARNHVAAINSRRLRDILEGSGSEITSAHSEKRKEQAVCTRGS